MTQLSGKVALVTGASSELGAATARLFAERGATVFGIARDTQRMAEVFAEVPGGTFASVGIARPDACRQAVQQCVAERGRLDVLVNAAGAGRSPSSSPTTRCGSTPCAPAGCSLRRSPSSPRPRMRTGT